MSLTLVIGNKNYSSWSLRPWLALKVGGVPFTEKFIEFTNFDETWAKTIAEITPTKTVPVLLDGELTIPDSLAIMEYVAEQHPDAKLWPENAQARAMARAVSAEMHAGFVALRTHMPMNIRRKTPGEGMGEGVAANVARLNEMWNDCRATYGAGGDFLFGEFSIADAMFAPVVWRLTNFAVDMSPVAKTYMQAVLDLPAMKEWTAAALAETWTVNEDEI